MGGVAWPLCGVEVCDCWKRVLLMAAVPTQVRMKAAGGGGGVGWCRCWREKGRGGGSGTEYEPPPLAALGESGLHVSLG